MKPMDTDLVMINGIHFSYRDIHSVIDEFYYRVQLDSVLSVPFRSVNDWPVHIQRLTHFWWIRFGGAPYLSVQYDPVTKHFLGGFNLALLSRWLTIFHEVLKKNLDAEQSEIWELVSTRIGQGLSVKNEMYQEEYKYEQQRRASINSANTHG